jgi:hypothetical protein
MTTDQENLIQCRASNGVAIQTSQPWEAGKPVSFIYAPAGRHMITAGFRKGETITICVENDSQTAVDLQESYDHLMATEPNQEPFGDEDHESKKATLRFPTGVTKFSWGEIKGSEGVIVAAEPTSYGSEAVNGKVYRSWSPEFATDADYTKARQKNKHWTFPDGVKGSESNPARIVGVSFVMGALTNRPAFRAMPPVKAKKAEAAIEDGIQAAGTSEGVKKSWETRKGQFMRGEGADNLKRAHSDAGGYAKREHAQVEIGRATLKSESHWMGSKKDKTEKIKHVEETHGKSDSEAEKHLVSKGWAVYHRSQPTEKDEDSPYNKGSDSTTADESIKSSSPILAHQADELTLSDLQSKVQAAASADSRFKGVSDPSGCIPCCGCYVADIIRDEDQNEWFAVISAGSKMKRVEFLIDAEDGSVVLGDEVNEVARKTVYAVDALCYNGEVIQAGDYPGHPFRGNQYADGEGEGVHHRASRKAHMATRKAKTKEDHSQAAELHERAAKSWSKNDEDGEARDYHETMAAFHHKTASKKKSRVKSSSPDLSSLYLKGAAQEPTLEQIFARVSANGVPAAVTN